MNMVLRRGFLRSWIHAGQIVGLTLQLTNACSQQDLRAPIPGMAASAHAGLNETAKPPLNHILHLTLALKGARKAELEDFISSQHNPKSVNYQRWLKPEEVGARFGASDEDIAAVVKYNAKHHLKVTIWPNHMFVSAQGTLANVQNAFHVSIHGYNRIQEPGAAGLANTFFAPEQNPTMPPSLANKVEGIYGLSNFTQMRSGFVNARRTSQDENPDSTTIITPTFRLINPPYIEGTGLEVYQQFTHPLSPADVSKVYNLDGLHSLGLDGTAYTIGIYSPTTVADSDIQHFCNTFSLGTPTIQHFHINGGAGSSAGAGEACLDAEVILGQAPKITIVFYESPNDGNLDTWNQIAADNNAVVSNSWSIDDYYLHVNGYDSYVASWDTILAVMDAQGIAHYNSSGDNGSHNHFSNVNSVGLPGSDPHVTCVGGTSLFGDANGFYQSESGWGGSGGGLSIYFSKPSWQIGPGVSNSHTNGMRQTPDISAIADPSNPGFYVYTGGSWWQYGGTSASTPLWAAANKLLNQRLNNILGAGHRTGLLNTNLYGLGSAYSGKTGFFLQHDVTTGNNGAYPCTTGWDFVAGWGSADFTKLAQDYLQNYQNQSYVDIAPYNPNLNGFTSPIMIHKALNDLTEPSAFASSETYYLTVCVSNTGSADSLPNNQNIQIDAVDDKFLMGPFANGGYYYYVTPLSKQFTVGTHTVTLIANADNTVSESSTLNNTYTRTISVADINTSVLSALSITPTSLLGGKIATGKVTLLAAAPVSGTVVNLSSSLPGTASVPDTVTVLSGAKTATFIITTSPVASLTVPVITASLNSVNKSANLSVTPPVLSSVSSSTTSLIGGVTTTGKVTLTGKAPIGGVVVDLNSADLATVTVPASLTIPAGSTTMTFPVTTVPVSANTAVVVHAVLGSVTKSVTLTVKAPIITALSLSPTTVIGGVKNSVGTITLSGYAPANGVVVSLSSSNTSAATVPDSVTVPAGQKKVTFTVTSQPVTVQSKPSITALNNTISKTVILTVNP